jgi:hypothetical protein
MQTAIWTKWIRPGVVLGSYLLLLVASAKEPARLSSQFQKDRSAEVLYRQMMETMRKATSLSWIAE